MHNLVAETTTTSSSSTMSHDDSNKADHDHEHEHDEYVDEHEHDMVMPGFRFHPTEEELVEFYLRRKVEGKRFNVELITFLDLYRYDPWELPAMAAIGEKEWFFYVPRDRKYRNGDRPNRVTTSGYWKATGADRMIRSENFRSIGLKKTLVFYSGKAPKGIRTSWIMNEYRLPHHETERYQKGEISLCRVYKRAGVEDHPSLPRCLPASRASTSRSSVLVAQSTTRSDNKKQHTNNINTVDSVIEKLQAFNEGQSQQIHHDHEHQMDQKMNIETEGSSRNSDVTTVLRLSKHKAYPQGHHQHHNIESSTAAALGQPGAPTHPVDQEEGMAAFSHHSANSKQSAANCSSVISSTGNSCAALFTSGSSSVLSSNMNAIDDLHRLLNYQPVNVQQQAASNHHQHQQYVNHHLVQYYDHHHHHPQPSNLFSTNFPSAAAALSTIQPQQQQLPSNTLPTAFSDRLWDWNPISEPTRPDYNNLFK
ncbi:NAC domain-containing protein 35 isoform X1 [Pyrus x bretschneideri]|uniref:NAC domain-containing protein 35 isoform X1 n=1 Tax=Pyrus x bretschneideri TaxID=225117 RepID=UPI00051083FC|nr:NAC domain-containing protein 35 isoform X1 [Pyrus x bretschneideri]